MHNLLPFFTKQLSHKKAAADTELMNNRKMRVINISNISWRVVWADEYDEYMRYYTHINGGSYGRKKE